MIPRFSERTQPGPRFLEPSPSFSFLEYDKAREKIPERTRSSVDTWREEVLAICQAHGVDHPSKLVTAEAHASAQTLERVQNLLDDILYVFEHQKLPPEKREMEPVDDQEYIVPMGMTEALKIPCKKEILDQNGRFLFLDASKNPQKIIDCEGDEIPLPINISSGDFALFGSKMVLVVKQIEAFREKYSLIDLDGEIVESARSFVTYKKRNGRLIAVGDHFNNEYHPVAEDGTIHWNIDYSNANGTELVDTFFIAGRRYFLIRENTSYKIYTADHLPVSEHRNYFTPPLLCEKDGKLIIIARGHEGGWWIYNDQGDPVKELPIPTENFVKEVVVKDGICVFVVQEYLLGDNGADFLIDEKGHCFWISKKGDKKEKIIQLSVQGSHLTFRTRTRKTTKDAHGLGETEDAYYDQEGKLIVLSPDDVDPCSQHPIFVDGSYVYANYDHNGHYGIHHGSFPEKTLGTFFEVYTIKAIDEYRFYVIGVEETDADHYQLAKRVYDTRKIKAPTKE